MGARLGKTGSLRGIGPELREKFREEKRWAEIGSD